MPADLETLTLRATVANAIRQFFDENGFLEVETPVWITAPANELHINAPKAGARFLRPSPELHMKRLICQGAEKIYQIGPCFREHEKGDRHNPEFTMLEWYRRDADYTALMRDCEELLHAVANACHHTQSFSYQQQHIDLSQPLVKFEVSDRYREHCEWDPATDWDADRFDLEMATRIEPGLPRDRPCILAGYPAEAAALAKLRDDDPQRAERFELYLAGLELANAFSELTDPEEQRARFLKAAEKRDALGSTAYPLDAPFLQALDAGMPPTAGAALGVDRLVMIMADKPSIVDCRALLGLMR